MKNVVIIAAVVVAFAFNAQQGFGQVQSAIEAKSEERGSLWLSQSLSVDAVPLNTGKQVSLTVGYSIRTSAGMCEVLLERVHVADRSMIQGAILGETFYKHIYAAIARHHAGTGDYPYVPELTSQNSPTATHVFKRGMMMSWIQPKGHRDVSIEPNPTSALCSSSYSFAMVDNVVQATSHGIAYNVKHTPEPSLSQAR